MWFLERFSAISVSFSSTAFLSKGYIMVVTRYMGSGITASGSGSWTRDPGSQVMGSGSANFFWSWRGSRIDRFLDTLFFMRNKNIPFCKEKGLFSGLLKKLLTFILQIFYVSVTQSAVKSFSRSYFMLHNFAVSALSDSLRNRILAYRYHAFMMRD